MVTPNGYTLTHNGVGFVTGAHVNAELLHEVIDHHHGGREACFVEKRLKKTLIPHV